LEAVRNRPVAIGSQHTERITLSIGVASAVPTPLPQGTKDYKLLAERLISEADAALYRAKSAGRDRLESSQNIIV
jgi:GGDEF domain-containing protein